MLNVGGDSNVIINMSNNMININYDQYAKGSNGTGGTCIYMIRWKFPQIFKNYKVSLNGNTSNEKHGNRDNETKRFMSSLDIDYERTSKVEDKSLQIIQTEIEKKNKTRIKILKKQSIQEYEQKRI